jgi:predicted RNA-binding protein YlxR (DUF448 family)
MLARVDHAETDTGPRGSAAVTERLCIVTRKVRPIGQLIRFVAGPDAVLVPDLKRRLPGRGVWVTAERQRVAEAVKRGAFPRSLHAEVKVAGNLPDAVETLLEKMVLDALSVARKAGQVVAGFTKVEAVAAQGTAVAFLHAVEAGADGKRKIADAIRRGGRAGGPKITPILVFSSAQLDLALGRPNVVHAALLAGRAAETFLARWRMFDGYRMGVPDDQHHGVELPNQEAPGLGSE